MPKRTLLSLLLIGGLALAAQAQTAPAADVTPAAAVRLGGSTTMPAPEPLLVVDGVPVSEKELNELNPADIESISVLKNIGCYSQRGAIIVRTKNAARQRTKHLPAKLLIGPGEISR